MEGYDINTSYPLFLMFDGVYMYMHHIHLTTSSDSKYAQVCDIFVHCTLSLFDIGAIGVGSATYGQGVGLIHIDDVQCDGDESDLFACSYTTNHNCIHAEDAGVQCVGPGSKHSIIE